MIILAAELIISKHATKVPSRQVESWYEGTCLKDIDSTVHGVFLNLPLFFLWKRKSAPKPRGLSRGPFHSTDFGVKKTTYPLIFGHL